MQAFSTQRLANQASESPFDNKYMLAALLVPHLEALLALHPEVRYLLLVYPPEHLATILAMQKLIGGGTMRVAQIFESQKSDDLPFRRISGATLWNGNDEETRAAVSSPKSHSKTETSPANYLLTSTAKEEDIAKFLSVVWQIQVKAENKNSDTEAPTPLKPTTTKKKKHKPPPLAIKGEPLSPFPKVTPQSPLSPDAPRMSKSIPAAPMALNGLALNKVVEPTSAPPVPALITVPAKTETNRTRASAPTATKQAGDDVESTYQYRPSEDSSDDMEERRLMPVFLQKKVLRRPNSRKALKFLGLS